MILVSSYKIGKYLFQWFGKNNIMSIDVNSILNLQQTIASGNGTASDRQSLIDQSAQNLAAQNLATQSIATNFENSTGSSSITKSLLSTSPSGSQLTDVANSIARSSGIGTATSVVSALLGSSSGKKSNTTQPDRRIKLRPKVGVSSYIKTSPILSPLATTNGLVFPSDLRINVNNKASYGEQHTTHMNQDFRYYTNTPAMQFDISGTFTAQNSQEAAYMLAAFHFLSLMTKMHTGSNSSTDPSIGLPPPVLLLSGFGLYNFNDLPVIMIGGNYNYDPSVDNVTVTVNGVPNDVPSLCTISVSVVVQNTPAKLRTFDWNSFASGKLLSSGGWK